jgi:hypothetical protein
LALAIPGMSQVSNTLFSSVIFAWAMLAQNSLAQMTSRALEYDR